MLFTALQGLEYYEAPFSIADSVYGSTFFVATGFHGLHGAPSNYFKVCGETSPELYALFCKATNLSIFEMMRGV